MSALKWQRFAAHSTMVARLGQNLPLHISRNTPLDKPDCDLFAVERIPLDPSREMLAGRQPVAFRRVVGRLEGGERLQRVPRGFPPDHPAASYLKYRMFVAGREFPASFATSPRFYAGVVKVFRHVTPLLRFLNEPLLKR